MIGKEIRLERIMSRETGKAVIVPMDHGVSAGPILGITNMRGKVKQQAIGLRDVPRLEKLRDKINERKAGLHERR